MLTTLRLSNFRCYSTLRWSIPAEGAVLLGSNAQGKTSLMEALCFALTLHSPRASKLDKLARNELGNFGISLETEDGTRRLQWGNRKLNLQVNGAERRDFNDYLADSYPVTWLANSDIALVTGAAEERRRYLDFLGTQWHPAYRQALQAYRKALKSRNALLRHPRRSAATLRSYANLLAQHGEIIMQLRSQLLDRLMPHIAHGHRTISGGAEQVVISYRPSTREPLIEALEANLEADERAGFTTVGPHRDDFDLTISGLNAAEFASEGQQRTLAIAMQMAQGSLLQEETGKAPILMVDDVFGELDTNRRQALLSMLPAEAQVFITTTTLNWLGETPLHLPVLRIEIASIAS
jgi:DNA replication and repair protein RecF